jgi:hypothetical protein
MSRIKTWHLVRSLPRLYSSNVCCKGNIYCSIESIELGQATQRAAEKKLVAVWRMLEGARAFRQLMMRHFHNRACLLVAVLTKVRRAETEPHGNLATETAFELTARSQHGVANANQARA